MAQLAPLAMHAHLDVAERQETGAAVLPGRADLALGGSTLANPRLPQDHAQRLHERHHPPGAARLAAFLVCGQLDRAQLQVDVEPVERADLLLPRRAIASKREGHRVLELQRVEKLGELGWRRDTVTGVASIAGNRTLAAGSCLTRSRSCAQRYSERNALTTLRMREPDMPA